MKLKFQTIILKIISVVDYSSDEYTSKIIKLDERFIIRDSVSISNDNLKRFFSL
ncbi:MAG: hypothetical protein K8S23_06355 [Candidatus Cloacimonetes bacterium]|nr:hypothetical protein [Candidatus Cloacimonadota bacterium]